MLSAWASLGLAFLAIVLSVQSMRLSCRVVHLAAELRAAELELQEWRRAAIAWPAERRPFDLAEVEPEMERAAR